MFSRCGFGLAEFKESRVPARILYQDSHFSACRLEHTVAHLACSRIFVYGFLQILADAHHIGRDRTDMLRYVYMRS